MELYERIRKRRKELQMSQDELASKMGYKSRSSINKIELGKSDIPQSKIKDFAKALNTTTSYLMGWEFYDNLTETGIRGIESWINNQFLDDYQRSTLKMHYADLLLNYKQLINRVADESITFNRKIDASEFEGDVDLLKEEWRAMLFKEISTLTNWIEALPFYLARDSQKRLANVIKAKG